MLIKQAPVVYPREAQEQAITGKVIVRVLINERGYVIEAELLKSLNDIIDTRIDEKGNISINFIKKSEELSSLDKAALQAARQCRFEPAIQNNRRVKSYFNIPYTFVRK